MVSKIKSATDIVFGKSTMALLPDRGSTEAYGFQIQKGGSTRRIEFSADQCRVKQEMSKKLAQLVRSEVPLLPDKTVYLGFYEGLIALAEGIVLENTNNWWENFKNSIANFIFKTKIYKGKILIDNREYNLVIYETDNVPTTELTYIVQ